MQHRSRLESAFGRADYKAEGVKKWLIGAVEVTLKAPNDCYYGLSFLSHVATALPKFPGVIACVAPGALLTRPLLTAKPLDLVYEGL